MGRCNCTQATCQCVLQTSDTVTVAGAGTEGSPYTFTVNLPHVLHSSATPVGNVGPGVDVLANVNVPAATLAATGDRLHFRAVFTLVAVAEDIDLAASYGGTPFYASTELAPIAGTLVLEGDIIRTGAMTQVALAEQVSSLGISMTRTNMAEDNGGANVFLITGQSGGAGETGAAVLESLTIDVLPL